MSDAKKQIGFNAFEMNCVVHQSPGLWRHPDDHAWDYKKLSYWTDLAQLLERGRFDGLGRWRRHGEEFSGARYLGLARGTCEQAVVTNAVEALWQDMEQEAPNELVRGEHNDALPLRTLAAVSL